MSLIRGNALAVPLADESVDLIVTSPPYFALRSYTDACKECDGSGHRNRPASHGTKVCESCGRFAAEKVCHSCGGRMQWPKVEAGEVCPSCNGAGGEHYDGQIGSEATPQAFLDALWAVTAECRRVLKPSGSMFVNLGDKYSGYVGAKAVQGRNVGGGERTEGRTPSGPVSAPDVWGIPAKSLMMLPQRYAIGCIDQLGLILRAEIIWSKPNGLPESVTDRVRRSHEQWFHFTKEPRYFSAVDEIREAYHPDSFGKQPGKLADDRRTGKGLGYIDENRDPNPLGKLPGSVWTIPTEPLRVPDHIGVDHFAAFPSEWPRRLILGWSPSGVCVACGEGRRPVVERHSVRSLTDTVRGRADYADGRSRNDGDYRLSGQEAAALKAEHPDTITGYACACPDTTAPTRPAVVLDPFAGTGTTTAVAHALGRHGIGIDLSADYLRLAEWRCNDPALRAKVLRVDKPKPEVTGQLDLLGAAS